MPGRDRTGPSGQGPATGGGWGGCSPSRRGQSDGSWGGQYRGGFGQGRRRGRGRGMGWRRGNPWMDEPPTDGQLAAEEMDGLRDQASQLKDALQGILDRIDRLEKSNG